MKNTKYNPDVWNPKLAKFMGWFLVDSWYCEHSVEDYNEPQYPDRQVFQYDWHPHEDLNQAFRVLNKLPNLIFSLKQDSRLEGRTWYCAIIAWDGLQPYPIQVSAFKETDIEAIYNAICAAVEKLEEKK